MQADEREAPPSPVPRRRVLALAAASAFLGVPARAQARPPIEVVHWWTSGGEGAAIRTIRRSLEERGATWIDIAVEGPDVAKAAAITRIVGGQPPTVMLWFVGRDLPELVRDGLIRDVHAVAEEGRWDAVLPSEISRRLKVGGRYVAAPADLHCGNLTIGNARVLAGAGAEMPATWPEVFAICEKLAATDAIPVAFGGQPWQETGVFAMMLAGVAGLDAYRRLVSDHDGATAESPEVVETFATFARLKQYVDRGSPNRSWADTANLIATNRAGLYFVGDWARGDLNKAGMRPGVDYLSRSAPGTAGVFFAVVDAFCMPANRDEAIRDAQDEFARTTMDPAVQHAFNLAKGSIPPRTDVPLTGYDAPVIEIAALTRGGGTIVPSLSMGMTTAMRAAMYDVVHRFWTTADADPRAAARALRVAIERNRA